MKIGAFNASRNRAAIAAAFLGRTAKGIEEQIDCTACANCRGGYRYRRHGHRLTPDPVKWGGIVGVHQRS